MKKKLLLLFLMWIFKLGFAASSAWLIYDIWFSITIKKFEMDSLPIFVFATGFYGLFSIIYYGKTKYVKRKIIPINKYYGIGPDSQTPIELCTKK